MTSPLPCTQPAPVQGPRRAQGRGSGDDRESLGELGGQPRSVPAAWPGLERGFLRLQGRWGPGLGAGAHCPGGDPRPVRGPCHLPVFRIQFQVSRLTELVGTVSPTLQGGWSTTVPLDMVRPLERPGTEAGPDPGQLSILLTRTAPCHARAGGVAAADVEPSRLRARPRPSCFSWTGSPRWPRDAGASSCPFHRGGNWGSEKAELLTWLHSPGTEPRDWVSLDGHSARPNSTTWALNTPRHEAGPSVPLLPHPCPQPLILGLSVCQDGSEQG